MPNQYNERIVKEWHEKSKMNNVKLSDLDKFICNWISFNAYLSYKYQNDNGRRCLDQFEREFYGQFQTLVSQVADLKHNINKLKKRTPVKDCRIRSKPPSKINDIKNIKEVFDVIYQIRCNLIHGDKSIHDGRDLDIVVLSNIILNEVMETFIDYLKKPKDIG